MNDAELTCRLKTAPAPERPGEYWDDFPSRIRVQLRRNRAEFAPKKAWRLRLACAGGFALGVVLTLACVEFRVPQAVSQAIAKQQRNFDARLARLDTGLHKLVLNTDGMGYLLTEPN